MKADKKTKLLASISDASRILGVNEVTLRQWTDEGLIKAFITPGGHRRYAREQLDEFIHSHQKMLGINDLVAKLEDTAGPLRDIGANALARAHTKLSLAQGQHLAILGRKILDEIIYYVSEPTQRENTLLRLRAIGADFGITLAQARLPLTDSIQAFISHRTPIVESVAAMMRQKEIMTEGILAALPLIDNIMDQSLIAMVEAYQASTKP
jgi:excisionase family DNA binding protein